MLGAGASTARAWNDVGHSAIALVTWRTMSPELRQKLSTILKAHPEYERDLLRDCPAGADKEEYAFYRAATWPDMIRSNNPMSQYHRGSWHYSDVAYYPFGGEDKYGVKIAPPLKPGEPYDAISAFEYSLRLLKNENAKMSDRAIALCWVLHIGGDIHQPLHCVALCSPAMPEGDKGGNSWMLTVNGEPMNLHSLWDGALGRDRSAETIQKLATELMTAHPVAEFADALKSKNIRQWTDEGEAIAVEKVYLYGMLNAAKRGDAGSPPPASQGYLEQMQAVCKQRSSLAGYRLTDTLTAVMSPGGVAPGGVAPGGVAPGMTK